MSSTPPGASVGGDLDADARDRAVRCDHCGLPVPAGLVEPGPDRQFCCSGCRMVWETIQGCGLGRFYALREEGSPAEPATVSGKGYEYLGDPGFQERFVAAGAEGRRSIELYLEGVHCAACVWLLEKLPHVLPGVIELRLDIGRRVARVVWHEETVTLPRIADTLDSLGYPPHPHRGGRMHDVRKREERRHLVRIGVAGACAGNVMLIAFALYGGIFHGMADEHRSFLRWISLGITVVALVGPGSTFFRGALSSVRAHMMHMDVPVAIALAAGTAWGAVNTVRGGGEVYFESLTAVVFLLLIGRWVQFRRQRAAQDAIDLLYCLTPATARRLEDEGSTGTPVREIPAESLVAGDRVEVRAGDSVPADGVILEGRSDLDLSLLTGEPVPVARGVGEAIDAGTVNLTARIVMEVERAGVDTRVGRLMCMVEEFARDPAPIVRLADRVAHRFVIVVLTLAVLTAAGWWLVDPALAVERAIALLIVTCPCALGLATPLAVVAAIGRAARAGILVKGGETIERLAASGLVLLDKTGTVTQGRMRLISWEGDDGARPLVAALEAQVAHPIARALGEGSSGTEPALIAAEVENVPGLGVRGVVEHRRVAIGSVPFAREHADGIPPWAEDAVGAATARALTPVLVAVDGTIVAVAACGDPVLDDAAESIARLRALGWEVGLLSGDHPDVVAEVARGVGIDPAHSEGGADPERKIEVVREALAADVPVMMVGDGVNDAAALAAATVGVAVHGGAEASLAAADVFLRRPGLAPLVGLVEGARRAVGVIKRNLAVSLLYNAVTATLAVAGIINPLLAAILMPISSLTVVTLSYRSRTFDPEGD